MFGAVLYRRPSFDTMVCSWGSGGGLVPPLAEEEKGTCGTVFLFFFSLLFLDGGG